MRMQMQIAQAIREGTPEEVRLIIRHRRACERLFELDLRDRWGYPLEPHKLAAIAEEVVLIADQDALLQRKKAPAVIAELVDHLAVQMLTGDLPMFCDGHDTPPEDDSIEEVVRTILNLKESA